MTKKMARNKNPFRIIWESHFEDYMPKIGGFAQKMAKCCNIAPRLRYLTGPFKYSFAVSDLILTV